MEFDLPGFRFHPTEEELLGFYLTKTVLGTQIHSDIIGFLDIYLHEPWDLPSLAKIGEREWYFFVPRESKNGHGSRPGRTTEMGYWKATGSDRAIRCLTEPRKLLGHRKTMVFYHGRAPRGCKTDWVMNEYRLPTRSFSLAKEIVLCKVYRKATSLKVLEQRAAIEENARTASTITFSSPLQTQDRFSSYEQQKKFNDLLFWEGDNATTVHKVEEDVAAVDEEDKSAIYSSQMVGVGPVSDQIQLPNCILDWTMDPLWS